MSRHLGAGTSKVYMRFEFQIKNCATTDARNRPQNMAERLSLIYILGLRKADNRKVATKLHINVFYVNSFTFSFLSEK
uniref:CSON004780 protein n=1 Tax=Culicoides sonorensis TaxID=179676 RepID=A0A336LX50_CULSO